MILMNTSKGGSIYLKCQSFTVDEVIQYIDIYILHGLAPFPRFEMKFQPPEQNKANENDLRCEFQCLFCNFRSCIPGSFRIVTSKLEDS